MPAAGGDSQCPGDHTHRRLSQCQCPATHCMPGAGASGTSSGSASGGAVGTLTAAVRGSHRAAPPEHPDTTPTTAATKTKTARMENCFEA